VAALPGRRAMRSTGPVSPVARIELPSNYFDATRRPGYPRGMNPQSLSPIQRFEHYVAQAETLRDMAEEEPDARLREQLLQLAAAYQKMADSLGMVRPQSRRSPPTPREPASPNR
jgi:hypothetical protein